MYKIFSFVSLILSMLSFMGLQVLNVIQKNVILLSLLDSEEFNDIHFFGSLLVIPVLLLVLTIIFAYLSIKSNTNK
ncbi:TPA_asm: hypothetical protein GHG98_10795 [Listeria monocytogenes]|uniref:Uncharacterized protein n=2 Tax=Listeria monocytogenes TaxID=1639 RepID=A0A632V0D3_LISMN|nr:MULTISPECIES: hypothetical protein [Listeria]EAE3712334.1 hypothetical protein [Listeria monocytogenes serotype 1/2b]EEP3930765.1 hypothetical protein [Listeria monocytogenes serotype 4ab]MDA67849.1 hypothetical protein [Listeria monocytogenes serotype 3b]ASL49464.1 hypothetical protein FORC49_0391 [Listeria monocytogenes]EAA0135207.1 hypothetical protein [Listeria monocytogenes]